MKIEVETDLRVAREINKLSHVDQSKIREYIELFKEYGFGLGSKYLKKVNKQVWELRPGKWRLFILKISPRQIIIHIMFKKSQKITKKTMKVLNQRTNEYL